MLQPLVILGAGGFARETLDVVEAINAEKPRYDVLGFIVDEKYGRAGDIVNEKPILGGFSWLQNHSGVLAVCGVGAPEIRRQMIQRAVKLEIEFATLIHPNAQLTRWVEVGRGVIITVGCTLTCQIRLGDHVHLNLGCTIGHDTTISDFVTLSPGVHVSGNVHLQKGAYIGTGANIIEKRTVGAWSIVGAGSTVVKDVPPNSTVVGVPARVIKERPEGWHLHENYS